MSWYSFALSAILCLGLGGIGHADQLDDEAAARPAAVVVKVDPSNQTVTIYRAPQMDPAVKNADKLPAAQKSNLVEDTVDRIARPENKIGEMVAQPASELDREQSTSAWYRRSWSAGWGWSGWGGYRGGYVGYGYSWYRPWVTPGAFYYAPYGYRYSYGYGYYGYRGCHYGFYW